MLPESPVRNGSLDVAAIGCTVALEAMLLAALLVDPALTAVPGGVAGWLLLHALASAIGGVALARLLALPGERSDRRLTGLAMLLMLALPLAGALAGSVALWFGARAARSRHREAVWWQFTTNPDLPFTSPIGRRISAPDRRGFAEQLTYEGNSPTLYRRVLAAGRMRSSLSVDALNAGIAHADERIRLTAYQTLDRKVSRLNDEIDRLERGLGQSDAQPDGAAGRSDRDRADVWLQIASNYWELLTLEQGERVAREQLLDKASRAVLRSIALCPNGRNAHFTLGRIALRQGLHARAEVAFARATELGMPASATLPYRAEAAFGERDFARVRRLLASIDDAFTHYPPLRQVVAAWR